MIALLRAIIVICCLSSKASSVILLMMADNDMFNAVSSRYARSCAALVASRRTALCGGRTSSLRAAADERCMTTKDKGIISSSSLVLLGQ